MTWKPISWEGHDIESKIEAYISINGLSGRIFYSYISISYSNSSETFRGEATLMNVTLSYQAGVHRTIVRVD